MKIMKMKNDETLSRDLREWSRRFDRRVIGHGGALRPGGPVLSAMAGHMHGQFQAAPDAKFVESTAQMVLE
jgi:hypothetical protein